MTAATSSLARPAGVSIQAAKVGTITEQLEVAAWTGWSVPRLVNERILQGRKILAVKALGA